MSVGFPDDAFKELVRSRTDIVQLISETISLESRSGGHEYAGLCPWHRDSSPSLKVYPERQSYRCWVCDEGGDCFTFVQKSENISFREALEILAARAHLELPQREGARSGPNTNQLVAMYATIEWAAGQFHQFLVDSRAALPALDYLYERGFTDETIQQFQIGFHPGGWQWLIDRARGRFSERQLVSCRLASESRDGRGCFDFFRTRVMFPIRDERGRPVAFGGRVLPGMAAEGDPKYLNSVEFDLFKKSRLLYGFDQSREAIRRTRTVVVTEGYTDCIVCHQYGVDNVTATLGTALTEEHVRFVKRFADRIVLIYDGDAPGQNAAERALSKILTQEIDLRVMTLPGGMDPADFLSARGVEEFQQQIAAAPEAWEYKLQRVTERHRTGSVDDRQRILDEMLELISIAPSAGASLRKDILLGKLSRQLQVDERVIRQRLDDVRSKRQRRANPTQLRPPNSTPTQTSSLIPARLLIPPRRRLEEQDVLEIIFAAPDYVDLIRQRVGVDDFVVGPIRSLIEICFDLAEQGMAPSYQGVSMVLEDSELKRVATTINDSSIEKEIARKLAVAPGVSTDGNCPPYLSTALQNLIRRRDEQHRAMSKAHIARLPQAGGHLDRDTIEAMRRLMQIRQTEMGNPSGLK